MEQKKVVVPKRESIGAGTQTDHHRPSTTPSTSPNLYASPQHSLGRVIPSTSGDVIYESSPTTSPVTKTGGDDDDDDADDTYVDKDVLEFGKENFGEVASPYVSPYVYKRGFLDTTYGIRKTGNTFMIGNSPVEVDNNSNVHIKQREFKGTQGLWELLTRKRVDKKVVTDNDLEQYKTILELTNAHLQQYRPDADINVTRGLKFKEVISQLFPASRQSEAGVLASRHNWLQWK